MTDQAKNLKDKTILLGVTGGIAAYKSADLASKLKACGARVLVIMTENACKLITPKTFEAITAEPVITTLWNNMSDYKISHINLREEAEFIIVAPATANIIAKAALGISDDVLSTTLCACWNKPTLYAPAMNNMMWSNPAVQQNLQTIKDRGAYTIGPETGRLACGDSAIGRMSEPADILIEASRLITQHNI